MIQLVVERSTGDGEESRTLGPFAFIGVDGAALVDEYERTIAVLDDGQWHTEDDGKAWDKLIIESVLRSGSTTVVSVGTVAPGSTVIGSKITRIG